MGDLCDVLVTGQRPASSESCLLMRKRELGQTRLPPTPRRSVVIGRGGGSGEHRRGSPVLEWRMVGISRLGGEGAIYTVTKASDRPAFIRGGLGTFDCPR